MNSGLIGFSLSSPITYITIIKPRRRAGLSFSATTLGGFQGVDNELHLSSESGLKILAIERLISMATDNMILDESSPVDVRFVLDCCELVPHFSPRRGLLSGQAIYIVR
jgi:hypothetical protein